MLDIYIPKLNLIMGELDMYVSDKLDKYGYVDVDISRIMQHVRNKLGTCKRKNKSLSKVRNLFKIENLKLNLKTEIENLKLNDAATRIIIKTIRTLY